MYKATGCIVFNGVRYVKGDIIINPSEQIIKAGLVKIEDPLNIEDGLLTDMSSHIIVSNN